MGTATGRRNRRETKARARLRFAGQLWALALAALFLYGGARAWAYFGARAKGGNTGTTPQGQGQEERPDQGDLGETPEPKVEPTDADLSNMQVNELGKVMIIMYHDIQENEGDWVRSRVNFKADLQRYYDHGYVLVPLSDYLTGKIDVPAGKAPLVLTFDDGTKGQLTLIEKDGETKVDPNCAVGMLLDFSENHPEFGHAATFFVYSNPFGTTSSTGKYLKFLLDSGMEIGNHTAGHRDLTNLSAGDVMKEIGTLHNYVQDACGYETLSLALPYGGYPKATENLLSGKWEDVEYTNLGVLLVGAEPAPSPFSSKFNPLAIPRIQGSQSELDKWIGNYERYPSGRFVSDGQADRVTVRETDAANLSPDRVGDLEVRTYVVAPGPEGAATESTH